MVFFLKKSGYKDEKLAYLSMKDRTKDPHFLQWFPRAFVFSEFFWKTPHGASIEA